MTFIRIPGLYITANTLSKQDLESAANADTTRTYHRPAIPLRSPSRDQRSPDLWSKKGKAIWMQSLWWNRARVQSQFHDDLGFGICKLVWGRFNIRANASDDSLEGSSPSFSVSVMTGWLVVHQCQNSLHLCPLKDPRAQEKIRQGASCWTIWQNVFKN